MINQNTFLAFLFSEDEICSECRSRFKYVNKTIDLNGLKVYVLMEYNEAFKEAIIQYKECCDEALVNIFLYNYCLFFKRKYKNYQVIGAPSSKSKTNSRGFVPIVNIFSKTANVETYFEKLEGSKQAKRNKIQRQSIKNEIKLIKEIKCKKIVLVDDVLTTGSTLCAMASLIDSDVHCVGFVLSAHPLLLSKK